MLQADTLLVGKRMFRRQYRYQRFEPNGLDIECEVHSPWRMQQAEVQLPNANRLKPLFAVDVFEKYLNVRIRTPKAGDGVWDHSDYRGEASRLQLPDLSAATDAAYLDAAIAESSGPRHRIFASALKDGTPLWG